VGSGRRHIEVVGVDCHIGSQLTDIAPFVDAAGRVRRLVDRLLRKGFPSASSTSAADSGSGTTMNSPGSEGVRGRGCDAFRGLAVTLVLEPGGPRRERGVLLTEVLYTKPIPSRPGRGRSTSSSSTPP